MRKLTERGMKLAKIFRSKKYKVIEVYPHASKEILCLKNENDLIKIGVAITVNNKLDCKILFGRKMQGIWKRI
ncbi:MAG: hypothetical protein ACE5KT_09715 [Methanosarcinales archaeon]